MFLTVREGKVYTDNGGRRYSAGAEIDVDERTGESLIRNEVAVWSEHPRWKAANFKTKAIAIKTVSPAAQVTENVYDTLKADAENNINPVVGAPAAPADELLKKRVGRPSKNKE